MSESDITDRYDIKYYYMYLFYKLSDDVRIKSDLSHPSVIQRSELGTQPVFTISNYAKNRQYKHVYVDMVDVIDY